MVLYAALWRLSSAGGREFLARGSAMVYEGLGDGFESIS
jgi:hypothetical protein